MLGRSDNLVFRRLGQEQWYLSLGDEGVLNIGVLCWPVERVTLQGSGEDFWFVRKAGGRSDPHIMHILDETKFVAIRVEWKSPLSLMMQGVTKASFESVGREMSVCGVQRGGAEPLLALSARCAFWDLPSTSLDLLAKELGVVCEASASLFAKVSALVLHILDDVGENDLTDIMRHRLLQHDVSYDELLETAEVQHSLDEKDEKAFIEEKKGAVTRQGIDQKYREEYVKKVRAVRQAEGQHAAAGKGNAGGRGRGGKGGRRGKGGVIPSNHPRFLRGIYTQQELQLRAPPNSHVWRDNTRGKWWVHYPPFPRFSYPWLPGGEEISAQRILQHAWRLHLAEAGLTEADCPVQGVF